MLIDVSIVNNGNQNNGEGAKVSASVVNYQCVSDVVTLWLKGNTFCVNQQSQEDSVTHKFDYFFEASLNTLLKNSRVVGKPDRHAAHVTSF